MFPSLIVSSLLLLLHTSSIYGHGAVETEAETLFREAHLARAKRSFASCRGSLMKRDAMERRFSRTDAFINEHLNSRGIDPSLALFKRQLVAAEGAATCVLTPEIAEGPFFVDGELIRRDIRDGQPGVDLLLDVRIVDVNNCRPVQNVYVDFWSANGTGVYSGVQAEDTVGLNFLRGLQASDEDGVVQVLTKFPGIYSGRAQHIHVKAHVNGTVLPNKTYVGGTDVHTGQIFFDQSTLTQVNEMPPYSSNADELTLNSVDGALAGQDTSSYPVFVETRPLASNSSVGFIGFINVGIDVGGSLVTVNGATSKASNRTTGTETVAAGVSSTGNTVASAPSRTDGASSVASYASWLLVYTFVMGLCLI